MANVLTSCFHFMFIKFVRCFHQVLRTYPIWTNQSMFVHVCQSRNKYLFIILAFEYFNPLLTVTYRGFKNFLVKVALDFSPLFFSYGKFKIRDFDNVNDGMGNRLRKIQIDLCVVEIFCILPNSRNKIWLQLFFCTKLLINLGTQKLRNFSVECYWFVNFQGSVVDNWHTLAVKLLRKFIGIPIWQILRFGLRNYHRRAFPMVEI